MAYLTLFWPGVFWRGSELAFALEFLPGRQSFALGMVGIVAEISASGQSFQGVESELAQAD